MLALNLHSKQISFKAIYLSSRCKKTKIYQGFYLPEPSPSELWHDPVEELIALRDPHLHFATFNSIFAQKWILVKLFG